MRDRSYLTPTAQVVVGGLVLIVCLAWPPLFLSVCLVIVGRLVSRAGRGGKLIAITIGGVILALTIGLVYLLPAYAFIFIVVGVGAAIWLVRARLGAASSAA